MQVLPDEHARDMCLRFADMESKLGEIDRARAIYSYCSQICDPRVNLTVPANITLLILCVSCILTDLASLDQVTAHFWQMWKEFEIRHGNEDTIREMLRIKRSVQATYNTQVNFMSSQMLKATTNATGTSTFHLLKLTGNQNGLFLINVHDWCVIGVHQCQNPEKAFLFV